MAARLRPTDARARAWAVRRRGTCRHDGGGRHRRVRGGWRRLGYCSEQPHPCHRCGARGDGRHVVATALVAGRHADAIGYDAFRVPGLLLQAWAAERRGIRRRAGGVPGRARARRANRLRRPRGVALAGLGTIALASGDLREAEELQRRAVAQPSESSAAGRAQPRALAASPHAGGDEAHGCTTRSSTGRRCNGRTRRAKASSSRSPATPVRQLSADSSRSPSLAPTPRSPSAGRSAAAGIEQVLRSWPWQRSGIDAVQVPSCKLSAPEWEVGDGNVVRPRREDLADAGHEDAVGARPARPGVRRVRRDDSRLARHQRLRAHDRLRRLHARDGHGRVRHRVHRSGEGSAGGWP